MFIWSSEDHSYNILSVQILRSTGSRIPVLRIKESIANFRKVEKQQLRDDNATRGKVDREVFKS